MSAEKVVKGPEEVEVELEDDWDGEQFLNFPQTKINAAAQTAAVQHALRTSGLSDADIKQLDLLEAGCGPGAVTLNLAPLFRSLTAVETSPNMLKVLNRQLVEQGITDVQYALHPLSPSSPEAIKGSLPSPTADDLRRKVTLRKTRFDVGVSNLVLHHVDDLEPFLEGMLGLVKPGGYVVITEFDGEEAGIRLHEMVRPFPSSALRDKRGGKTERSMTPILENSDSDLTLIGLIKPNYAHCSKRPV